MIAERHPPYPIPLIPDRTKRVAIAVDLELYNRAKVLKIDMHDLFRKVLRESVEFKERENYEPNIIGTFDPGKEVSPQADFLSTLVRLHDERDNKPGPDTRGAITERLKEAAHRARGHAGPFDSEGESFSGEDPKDF